MTNTTYEILALLERHFEESVTLLKKLSTRPGQRSAILTPLTDQLRYVRAQIGFEVTEQASDFEMERADHWGRIHKRYEDWLKDPDDVYFHVQDREELRKKKGLPPRAIILPWSHQEEEKLLTVKRAKARKKRETNPRNRSRRPAGKGEATP
jgi:hypothetical protein